MQKSDIINVGVVGLGPRGASWLPLFKTFPQCRVVAVCDAFAPVLRLHWPEL